MQIWTGSLRERLCSSRIDVLRHGSLVWYSGELSSEQDPGTIRLGRQADQVCILAIPNRRTSVRQQARGRRDMI